MKLRPHQDVVGQAMYAKWRTGTAFDLIERDDGFIEPSYTGAYVAPYRYWADCEKRVIPVHAGPLFAVVLERRDV